MAIIMCSCQIHLEPYLGFDGQVITVFVTRPLLDGVIVHMCTINLQAVSFLRKQSIMSLLYIDNRLLEEYNGKVEPSMNNSFTCSRIAIHWAVMLLVGLGYFLNMSKSVLSPTNPFDILRDKIKNIRDFLQSTVQLHCCQFKNLLACAFLWYKQFQQPNCTRRPVIRLFHWRLEINLL